jgi:predicted Zn-ribbon and HTH transcriptional regulator
MTITTEKKCLGCGKTLTVLNAAIDVQGYCASCAVRIQDYGETAELPPNATCAAIVAEPLAPDMLRFTGIWLFGMACCLFGAIVGAWAESGNPYGIGGDVIRASWLFCFLGIGIARVLFLRTRTPVSHARWSEYWPTFVVLYFVIHVIAVIIASYYVKPRVWDWARSSGAITRTTDTSGGPVGTTVNEQLTVIPTIVLSASSFVPTILVAQVLAMLWLKRGDRSIKSGLCERCPIPDRIVGDARAQRWDNAIDGLRGLIAESSGLLGLEVAASKLYRLVARERDHDGDIDGAIAVLEQALPYKSSEVRYDLAVLLSKKLRFTEACELLEEIVRESENKGIRSKARKFFRSLRRHNMVLVRCPKCQRGLNGMKDQIGKLVVCPRCKSEFELREAVK